MLAVRRSAAMCAVYDEGRRLRTCRSRPKASQAAVRRVQAGQQALRGQEAVPVLCGKRRRVRDAAEERAGTWHPGESGKWSCGVCLVSGLGQELKGCFGAGVHPLQER